MAARHPEREGAGGAHTPPAVDDEDLARLAALYVASGSAPGRYAMQRDRLARQLREAINVRGGEVVVSGLRLRVGAGPLVIEKA